MARDVEGCGRGLRQRELDVIPADAELVSDYDFHPGEPHVRCLRVPKRDVLRLDSQHFVSEATFGETVLRHYDFHDEWFTVNVTLDGDGKLLDSAPVPVPVPVPGEPAFALRCDLATPMRRVNGAVFAVDLFAAVLVQADGIRPRVIDPDELAWATVDGLVSPHEAYQARLGLDRLVGLITQAKLLDFLDHACPFGPSRASTALPVEHAPLEDLPSLQPKRRPSWFGPAGIVAVGDRRRLNRAT